MTQNSDSATEVIDGLDRLAAFSLNLAWELNAELGRFCTDPIHEEHRLEIEAVREALMRLNPERTDIGIGVGP